MNPRTTDIEGPGFRRTVHERNGSGGGDRPPWFKWEVGLGNLLSILTIILAGIGIWADTQSRIAVIDEQVKQARASLAEIKIDLASRISDAKAESSAGEIRLNLRISDVKESIDKTQRQLEQLRSDLYRSGGQR